MRSAEPLTERKVRIVFRTDAGATAELEEACRALHAHHGRIAPTLAGLSPRDADDACAR
jgi:hypothetical protein